MLRTLLIALLVTGCPREPKPKQEANVIATINGEAIARADFEKQLARELRPMDDSTQPTPEQVEPYKQALLDSLIERTLLLQEARAQRIEVSAEEVDRRMLTLSAEYSAGTFDETLARNGTSRAALTASTREQLVMEKLLAREVHARVGVTEEQLRRYFEEHPGEFDEPEQVRAAQIVVKGLDDAKRVQQQLWQGKKFPELARRYSLSPDARLGGDLGFFARGTMPPAFDEVVFKLSVGGTSDVVTTEYGYHLFRVLEKKPAKKRELAEVRALIEEKLLAELRNDAWRRYVAGLRAKATLVINDEELQSVRAHAEKPGAGL